ncbi:glutamine--fructose-6-phosphate transaminase (isomerizing) [Acetanaerobacterium elongatum]|uniref:Glutamine--fructose-6-phosphate aminotransferase [isomerizing] n=1 Tax=Acetanaerobacterium elongatum TaxID=258515 RepID=A0A1G9VZV7_9FIRM|nr:glutamine--fructose-6-phosphate transaminase (isomerizing) [Acetanaerobacterium elongatum]SDM77754.1 glucosamine--fructose-6-phosphate aminotransferase (isomerizing) [Acetanaerobacterium elongatum]
MCGIVGYVGARNATEVLIEGLRMLEYRGYDSAGISVFNNNTVKTVKSLGKIDRLEQKLEEIGPLPATCGIGHTRWATHGMPSDINAHPHATEKVSVVHNGIIENYLEIRKELMDKGISFVSQTDTESLARLIDSLYDGDPVAAIRGALARVKGAYALGMVFYDKKDVIYAVRKDNPLIVAQSEDAGEFFIASDIPAVLAYTKRYYVLEEGEIAVLAKGGVTFIAPDGSLLQKPLLTAAFTLEQAQKGGYEHFMLKEIYEQPKALQNTITPRVKNGLPNFSSDNVPDELLKNAKAIHITACGTAMHAGLVGKSVMERLARVPVNVDIASEFRYRDPLVNEGDLVIIISQSGETADTLAALRLAKNKGAKTLAIVNVVGSSIAREADCVVYTHAGVEIAVASTKAYMVQLSVLHLLAVRLGLLKGMIDEAEGKRLVSLLGAVGETLEQMLSDTSLVQAAAQHIVQAPDIFFIGRGRDYYLSMEGALKLKEISYIHCEAYAAGELKHGTLSLITDGVPVIALAVEPKLFEKTISNIKEVKARGAYVVAVLSKGVMLDDQTADTSIHLPECDEFTQPFLTAAILQLLAYYTAKGKGLDIDKPRNLAKSVTVE